VLVGSSPVIGVGAGIFAVSGGTVTGVVVGVGAVVEGTGGIAIPSPAELGEVGTGGTTELG